VEQVAHHAVRPGLPEEPGVRVDGALQALLLRAGRTEPRPGLLRLDYRERQPEVVLLLVPRQARGYAANAFALCPYSREVSHVMPCEAATARRVPQRQGPARDLVGRQPCGHVRVVLPALAGPPGHLDPPVLGDFGDDGPVPVQQVRPLPAPRPVVVGSDAYGVALGQGEPVPAGQRVGPLGTTFAGGAPELLRPEVQGVDVGVAGGEDHQLVQEVVGIGPAVAAQLVPDGADLRAGFVGGLRRAARPATSRSLTARTPTPARSAAGSPGKKPPALPRARPSCPSTRRAASAPGGWDPTAAASLSPGPPSAPAWT
jgi:hypothetical protein